MTMKLRQLKVMYWEDLSSFRPSADLMDALQECQLSGRSWSSQLNNNAKELLQKELLRAQKWRCGYCRRKIANENGKRELDHILPKAASQVTVRSNSNATADRRRTNGYPFFTFTIWNLVLTCKRCNTKKGTYDSRLNRVAPVHSTHFYSLDPGEFEWIHPFLHQYSQHINIRENVVYEVCNGSANGEAVIRECKLDEIAAVEVAAREAVLTDNTNCLRAIGELIANVELIGQQNLINQVSDAFLGVDKQIIERTVIDMMT